MTGVWVEVSRAAAAVERGGPGWRYLCSRLLLPTLNGFEEALGYRKEDSSRRFCAFHSHAGIMEFTAARMRGWSSDNRLCQRAARELVRVMSPSGVDRRNLDMKE